MAMTGRMLVETVLVICPTCRACVDNPYTYTNFWEIDEIDRAAEIPGGVLCLSCGSGVRIRRPKQIEVDR